MAGKYEGLTARLVAESADKITLTFDEIENVLGFSLPASARTHQAWWANQSRAQSWAWEGALYKTKDLDLKNQVVTFVRAEQPVDEQLLRDWHRVGLSIDEAKKGLAERYGVEPDQIQITIKG